MEEKIKGKYEMEETIKGIEVIAYKGMEFDMTCKGFQYEIGKTYKTDKAELCNCGFHACLNPRDILYYYPKNNSRYFKVKLSGEITKCSSFDTNVAATEITILEEITDTFNEVIKTTEWWKNDNVLDLLYFSDGLARVQRGDSLYNFIDKQGNYLSKEWFMWLDDFKDGFAKVQRRDGLWNLIDKDGQILSNEWFNWVDNFHDGLARVQRTNDEYNFINKQGKYLSKEWFNLIYTFYNGFAEVERTNGEWCQIDKTGNLIKILQ